MPPSLSPDLKANLIAVAQALAHERGWVWLEPVVIEVERSAPNDRTWAVRTNAQARGASVRVVIREADLTIVSAGFLPR